MASPSPSCSPTRDSGYEGQSNRSEGDSLESQVEQSQTSQAAGSDQVWIAEQNGHYIAIVVPHAQSESCDEYLQLVSPQIEQSCGVRPSFVQARFVFTSHR